MDEATYIAVSEQHMASFFRTAYSILKKRHDAEDAVQETFLKAHKSLSSFRGDSSAKTWLTRIAIRTCCDMRRGFWFRRMDRRITPEMLPDQASEADEDESALTLAVMNLPKKEREVILLYYYQDMTMKEIAESLNIAVSSVSGRLKQACAKLRKVLEKEGAYGR